MVFFKRKFPRLDEDTKKALNNLDLENQLDYAYKHCLLGYGIDAVIHVYLMKKAKDIVDKKISLEKFVEKYGLKDFESKKHGFLMPLVKIEEEIFIPKQRQEDDLNREIEFFSKDYLNVLMQGDNKNLNLFRYLTSRDWNPKDLENLELIENEILFGEEFWLKSMKGFRDWRKNSPKPKDLEKLQNKLIKYYSQLIKY
ncbi:MAG: hypothetical protein WC812_00490 [Candidatus Pacearchaeota archaeon]|jgi:hypothetical protein